METNSYNTVTEYIDSYSQKSNTQAGGSSFSETRNTFKKLTTDTDAYSGSLAGSGGVSVAKKLRACFKIFHLGILRFLWI